jgi:cell division protein ZapE
MILPPRRAGRTLRRMTAATPISLVQRHPTLEPDRLFGELIPPPRFAEVTFDSYQPDPAEPSQTVALQRTREFAATVANGRAGGSGRRRWWHRDGGGSEPSGIYLDGGFGVGKTHLLASMWRSSPQPRLFATFVELTHLVGALGFAAAVQRLSDYRLLCIDEFELDDPGDTVLVASLLGRLVESGVRLAATSNTLPDRLGEGRFAAEDFLREIQSLSARFEVVRVDGPDYRHRGLPQPPEPLDDEAVTRLAVSTAGASLDHFVDVCRHLPQVHPSRYSALLDGVSTVCLHQVRTVTDQTVGLRLVVLADRLYDRDIPVLTSGVPLDRLFPDELLAGGYRKKYLRAISRLDALAREAQSA